MEPTGSSFSFITRTQLYFSLYGVYLVTEIIFPTIAFIATLPSAYLGVSISLVLLCGCFVALKYVDESTVRDDSGHPEDTESTASLHTSEATEVLPDQASQQTNLLTLLRSRKVLFILVIFTLPAFAYTALQALIPYLLANRRPDQNLQQVLVTIFSAEIFRVVLFAFFAPWAIAFAQTRFRIRQAKIDTWIIRGSLLLMAIGGAFMTAATTVASRTIGESVSKNLRANMYLFTNYHSYCGLFHRVWLESVPVVICYFPGGAKTPWATVWYCSGCGDDGSAHHMAHFPTSIGQCSQKGRPVA